MKNLFGSQNGIVPVVVIWALILLAVGALIGVTAFLLSQAAVALLGIITMVLILVYVVVPSLPTIVRHIKAAVSEGQRKEEPSDENDKK